MDKTQTMQKGLFLGDRKNDFKNFLKQIFENSGLTQDHVDFMLKNKSNFSKLCSAFTCETIDNKNNYEYSEHIGDGFYNAFLVSYIYRKFPRLRNSDCVKIVARLKINYASKNELCKIAEENGFWNYISADLNSRQTKKKKLLEDCFEAFIGAVVQIMDEFPNDFGFRIGYPIAQKILEFFFSKVVFSFKYEDLYDPITRLKELRDMLPADVGTLETVFERKDQLVSCSINRIKNGVYQQKADGSTDFHKLVRGTGRCSVLACGTASIQPDAEQKASETAIELLKREGLVKHPPHIYSTLSENKQETTERDVFRICHSFDKVNDVFQTKGKKDKYTCSSIFHFLQHEDMIGVRLCLQNGANPNIQDAFGLTCLDVIMLKRNKELFGEFWKLCRDANIKLDVHSYTLSYFSTNKDLAKLVNILNEFN